MTEGRGTGIPKIIRECKVNGSSRPVFHTDEERTFLTVELPLHPAFLNRFKDTEGVKSSGKTSEKILSLFKISSLQRFRKYRKY
ncbi:hypothetical protein KAR34_07035 [bacterium]|nr:hypothetical protein [bacterium]